MKHIAFLFLRDPIQHSVVIDGFDAALTAAIFDQTVSVFISEAANKNHPSINDKIKTLNEFDNVSVYQMDSFDEIKTQLNQADAFISY